VTLAFFLGCATPYRPMKAAQGFADTQIAADEFRVTFQGNGQTKPEEVSDFALLRAAQLTLAHGFAYFTVEDVTNLSSARPYLARQQFHSDYPPNMGLPPPTPGGYDPYSSGYIIEYDEPAVYYRPGTRLLVKCFRTRPEKGFAYDAAALEQSLRQKYRLLDKRAIVPGLAINFC
jgi:hypothetical protein